MPSFALLPCSRAEFNSLRKAKGSVFLTPTYYYIGHFSKFVKPGASRVSSAASRSALESTTFENPSAERVTVVMNRMDELVDYALTVGDKEVNASIPQHAM